MCGTLGGSKWRGVGTGVEAAQVTTFKEGEEENDWQIQGNNQKAQAVMKAVGGSKAGGPGGVKRRLPKTRQV